MATITWNTFEEFGHISRYDSSTDTLTSIDSDATTFDYFDDNMTAGDFLALVGSPITQLSGSRRRDIKINVGTAVAADSVVIKLQYNNNAHSNWTDIADVTSYFTSTGEKTIIVEPPDYWDMNYFSASQVGGWGWVYRFYIESVTNPTEGGANTTESVKGGDNTFHISGLTGGNPLSELYDYDVANSIGLISKAGDTYTIGKAYIVVGEDGSSINLDGTNVVFDGSDVYLMYLLDLDLSWDTGVYSIYVGNYSSTGARGRFRVFSGIDGNISSWSFTQSGHSYSTMEFYEGAGGLTLTNVILNVLSPTITLSISNMSGLVADKRINVAKGSSILYGLIIGLTRPFYTSNVYNYEADLSSTNLSTYSSYETSAQVDCVSTGGRIKSGRGSNWAGHQVLNTYQAFIRDKNGNPLDDALVKINQTSINIPEIKLSGGIGSSGSRIRISGRLEGEYFCRDTIVKVDDEIMRITGPFGGGHDPGNPYRHGSRVERAVLGTTIAAHDVDTPVIPLGIGYFKTGYVDWNLTETDFLSSTAVADTDSITIFDNQPLRFTKLVINISNITGTGTLTITGTDIAGKAITEDIPINGNGYYTTAYRFTSITQADVSGFSGNLKIGLYGSFYPLHIIDNTIVGNTRHFYEDYEVEISKDGYETLKMENVKFKQKTLMELELQDEVAVGVKKSNAGIIRYSD